MCDHPPIEENTKRQMEGSLSRIQGEILIVSVHQFVLKNGLFKKNHSYYSLPEMKNNPYLFYLTI